MFNKNECSTLVQSWWIEHDGLIYKSYNAINTFQRQLFELAHGLPVSHPDSVPKCRRMNNVGIHYVQESLAFVRENRSEHNWGWPELIPHTQFLVVDPVTSTRGYNWMVSSPINAGWTECVRVATFESFRPRNLVLELDETIDTPVFRQIYFSVQ